MAPHKYVIKCGNFAVLVDLHVLARGDRPADPSWFTAGQVEEVTMLVRDAVDQRVKQYTEALHNRRVPKHKKELMPASAFYVKGDGFNLAANFLKRHSNLRCIAKQLYGDLRVFPERFVVCVRCPEDASALWGNLSRSAKELSEQSRSEYFSKAAETQEPLHIPTKTKKSGLQKIAKQASVQNKEQKDPQNIGDHTGLEGAHSKPSSDPVVQIGNNLDPSPTREQNNRNSDKLTPHCQHKTGPKTSKPTRDEGEDPVPQRAKRACLESSTQTSRQDPESKTESKAFPVSERVETAVEVELLTPGKRAPRQPLTSSNNTAQTNQNRPAASLRGLSDKHASSNSSITSRSTQKREEEEGSGNVPRASRLRRMKRS
ncbi:protein SLX4IP isoform X1 [Periophthalmus magnuspinnatus]|uniref:protein SLX4IP isoform X1 n=1 Tax=Periophthalmus magnuspinnatus TaxID=409849 RepID=UPI00243633A4|nr:protein SLX4IP isoform X1 [Periophthalmus magnuspinnatus]